MKNIQTRSTKSGTTLIEMTIVIMVILIIMGVATMSMNQYRDWATKQEAIEDLRSVHMSQKAYLADNPTKGPSTLTEALITPYMPNQASFPTFKDKDDKPLEVTITTVPPTLSGHPTGGSDDMEDGQWNPLAND
ncbi:hypothetical protein [Persicirhabdus sediminis]|uniref:Prepilin-type N-terminal cleavage/methylation domain-containing protein n=1 Tax=Persicirhabdus sediminis TaxID=454144 RepID=A0A8J7SL16_9BACT|nr:hypothetical protein [Persicirhabdus sediminis]MBK1790113.1 hypothetical protein [Persicirhabdus sediminis]